MRLYLAVFGREVIAIEANWGAAADPAETLADAIAQLADEDNDEDEDSEVPQRVTGGPTHNFERDEAPVDPHDRYAPWDDRKHTIGFG